MTIAKDTSPATNIIGIPNNAINMLSAISSSSLLFLANKDTPLSNYWLYFTIIYTSALYLLRHSSYVIYGTVMFGGLTRLKALWNACANDKPCFRYFWIASWSFF